MPLFSKYVEQLRAGHAGARSTPPIAAIRVASLRDLPAGEYWVQPFVNVYTRFPRADGHTVWLHMDQWEGQNWKRSPGNLYGDPVKVTFDPAVDRADQARRRQGDPARSGRQPTPTLVKRIKIQSQILTKWWGHPIYLGATVLLPKDYDTASRRPLSGQLRCRALLAAARRAASAAAAHSTRLWLADDTPRFIYVTLQHPSPYYDDSYGVNSENNGPYGDAIMQELMPAVETQFRVDPRAVGADAVGRIDRRLDRRGASGLLSRLLRRIVRELPRLRSTSAITRSSTSTTTRTPISSTRAG